MSNTPLEVKPLLLTQLDTSVYKIETHFLKSAPKPKTSKHLEIKFHSILSKAFSNICGINLGDCEIKLLQYADDTIGVLKDDASLKALLDVIEDFEKISGLKINTSKSECMGIGEARGRKGDFFGLKWPEHPIKCLGVYLTYDYDDFIKMNYKQRLKKLENTANWWKGGGLTLYGRAQIINSLLLPKLIYIASMFVVPEEIIKKSTGLFLNFYGEVKTELRGLL